MSAARERMIQLIEDALVDRQWEAGVPAEDVANVLLEEPAAVVDALVDAGVLARGLVCGADITPIPSNHEVAMLRGKTTVELAVEKDDLTGVLIGGPAVVLLPKREVAS